MTFQEHLEWASRAVARWPEWKQRLLGGRQPYYRIEWKDTRGRITRYTQMYLTLDQAANAARVRSLLPEHEDDTMFVYNPVEELVATYYRGQGMAVNDGLGAEPYQSEWGCPRNVAVRRRGVGPRSGVDDSNQEATPHVSGDAR